MCHHCHFQDDFVGWTLFYVGIINVCVTGISILVMCLTALIASKGMLQEFVTVVMPQPSVNNMSRFLMSVHSMATDIWSMTTHVTKKKSLPTCHRRTKKML
jgi:hypothetical protein